MRLLQLGFHALRLSSHLHSAPSSLQMTRYWILKSEPSEYSIEELEKAQTGRWDGIRNYQARNYIREMQENDIAYFYHSSCKEPGIVGAMTITSTAYPDPTAEEKGNKYFDNRIKDGNNPWASVNTKFLARYEKPLFLPQIKALDLGPCPLTARGNRLSVIPITEPQFEMLRRELALMNEEDA